MSTPKILVCYDGSEQAAHAITLAGGLFAGAHADILHVWEPIELILTRYAALATYVGEQASQADDDARTQSSGVAAAGVALAQAAGLDAHPHTARLDGAVWEVVLGAARDLSADLIVTGTRSLHGVREVISGTLSHALLQHSELPVLAIPAPHKE